MSSNFDQGFAANSDPSQLAGSNQGEGGGYDGMSQSSQTDQGMGGGAGAHGSGVAGGYSSNADQQQTNTGTQAPEKQDWLDKGIEWAGKKAGVNVSDSNADKAGDFANKEFSQYEGRKLPGVQ